MTTEYEYQKETGTFLVRVTGRIDTGNAEEFGQKVRLARKMHPEGRLSFDLEKVTYVSSSGLRTLLKLARSEKESVSAVNVSAEVREIFQVTGFDKIFQISQKMRQVSIDGCTVIGRGANGVVYRLDDDTIIKIFQPSEDLSAVIRERTRAQAAMVKGLPTAISYDVVRAGDSYGIVFEMLRSRSLADVLREDEADFDSWAARYTNLLKEVHRTAGDPQIFDPVKEIYLEGLEYCSGRYSAEEVEKLRSLILSVPERGTLIHGDYHPKNIMLIDDELTLIDMGDLSTGHPVFDFLATAATQVNLVRLDPVFAEQHTGMKAELVNRLWDALLKGYFAGKSPEEIAGLDRLIRNFSRLKAALAPFFAKGISEDLIRSSIEDARKNFFPVIDELTRSLAQWS